MDGVGFLFFIFVKGQVRIVFGGCARGWELATLRMSDLEF